MIRVLLVGLAIAYALVNGVPFIGGSCPASRPIRGNAKSMIYHVPGGEFYDRTNAEDCFASEFDAQAAGYRRSLR
jgi:hypothetical protein